jgi:hypothetical protein
MAQRRPHPGEAPERHLTAVNLTSELPRKDWRLRPPGVAAPNMDNREFNFDPF